MGHGYTEINVEYSYNDLEGHITVLREWCDMAILMKWRYMSILWERIRRGFF